MNKKEIETLNSYLLKVTVFTITGKEKLKKEICDIIDERFEYIEKDIKMANNIINK